MAEHAKLCKELETTWQRDIPLAAAMGIAVESYDGRALCVRAPLAQNRNLHGTAFAGSLFSVCVLTGWGATWLALRERNLDGLIVVAESHIQYRKAVAGDLVCRCSPAQESVARAVEQFIAKGRASLPLECSIERDSRPAVTFVATYVVQAEHR